MPINFGTLITVVTYNAPLGLVVDGQAFAANLYPVSNVEISINGSGVPALSWMPEVVRR